MYTMSCDNCGASVEVTERDGEILCPRCYTVENLPEYFWKFFRYARRSDISAVLVAAGCEIVGDISRDLMLNVLYENVASGRITPDAVIPAYREVCKLKGMTP